MNISRNISPHRQKSPAQRALHWTMTVGVIASLSGPANGGTAMVLDANGFSFSVPVTSLQERRFSTTVRQTYDFSCGSAALATLLSFHYGNPTTEDQVFEEMFKHGDQQKIRREGFSLLDMKLYLESHGYVADGYRIPLERLERAGVPAIVLISESGYNHFVVIKGIASDRVLLGDPSKGTRTATRDDFEMQMWTNNIIFVIHGGRTSASFNEPSDWDKAPLSSLAQGVSHDGIGQLVLSKYGSGGF